MNKFTCLMIVGAVLSMSAPALAQSRAVNISVGSIGGPLDNAAFVINCDKIWGEMNNLPLRRRSPS